MFRLDLFIVSIWIFGCGYPFLIIYFYFDLLNDPLLLISIKEVISIIDVACKISINEQLLFLFYFLYYLFFIVFLRKVSLTALLWGTTFAFSYSIFAISRNIVLLIYFRLKNLFVRLDKCRDKLGLWLCAWFKGFSWNISENLFLLYFCFDHMGIYWFLKLDLLFLPLLFLLLLGLMGVDLVDICHEVNCSLRCQALTGHKWLLSLALLSLVEYIIFTAFLIRVFILHSVKFILTELSKSIGCCKPWLAHVAKSMCLVRSFWPCAIYRFSNWVAVLIKQICMSLITL